MRGIFLVLTMIITSGYGADHVEVAQRHLPAGSYMPFFSSRAPLGQNQAENIRKPISVASFWLDVHAVTNQDFLKFVKNNPSWRRSNVARVFADEGYLKHWQADLVLKSKNQALQPVTQVSWFAAEAYCNANGQELPTVDQWEYAAEDNLKDPVKINQQILKWYGVPNAKTLEQVKKQAANSYGIYDLHGLIWEWTLDFSSAMIAAELRSDGSKDDNLFCGAGSLNALNPADYAKFMRYSMRNSLKADYTTANLGFRCAGQIIKNQRKQND